MVEQENRSLKIELKSQSKITELLPPNKNNDLT